MNSIFRITLIGILISIITSCRSNSYVIQHKQVENAFYDASINYAEIQKKKRWKGQKLAFLFPHNLLPNLDSISKTYSILLDKGYRLVVVNPPGEDLMNVRSILSWDNFVNPVADFLNGYYEVAKKDNPELILTIVGEGLGTLPAMTLGNNLPVDKWILKDPVFATLLSNLQMISVEQGPQMDSLMTIMSLENTKQWMGLYNEIEKRLNPDLLIDAYPVKYLHDIKDRSIDAIFLDQSVPVLVIAHPGFPWSSTFFRREMKKRTSSRENFIWTNFTGVPADDNQNIKAEMEDFL